MPPIYRPDGTEVSRVVLPDGTDASTVTDPDGNVVFDANAIPDSGVSRWTLDNADTSGGTTTDMWGGHDASINGATTGASGANQTYTTNEAFSFDGADDYLDTGDDFADSLSEISLAAWVYMDSTTGKNVAIGKDDDTNGRSWNLYVIDGSIGLEILGAHGVFEVGSISTNTWTHIGGSWDGSTAYVYKDGSQVSSTSSTGSINNGSTSVTLGRRNFSGSEAYLTGNIDDARIYSKALSSTEWSDLYNTGSI